MSDRLKNNGFKIIAILVFAVIVHFMFLSTKFNFYSIFIRPEHFKSIFIPVMLLLSGLTYCYGFSWLKHFRSTDLESRNNIADTAGKLTLSIILISVSVGLIGTLNHWTDQGALGPIFGGAFTEVVVATLFYVTCFLPLSLKSSNNENAI